MYQNQPNAKRNLSQDSIVQACSLPNMMTTPEDSTYSPKLRIGLVDIANDTRLDYSVIVGICKEFEKDTQDEKQLFERTKATALLVLASHLTAEESIACIKAAIRHFGRLA